MSQEESPERSPQRGGTAGLFLAALKEEGLLASKRAARKRPAVPSCVAAIAAIVFQIKAGLSWLGPPYCPHTHRASAKVDGPAGSSPEVDAACCRKVSEPAPTSYALMKGVTKGPGAVGYLVNTVRRGQANLVGEWPPGFNHHHSPHFLIRPPVPRGLARLLHPGVANPAPPPA
ncbi:unnamed protein product [Lota lota]